MRKWFTTTRENWAKLNWWKCNRLLLSYLYQALPLDIPLRSRTPYIIIRILIPSSFAVITIILSCPVVYQYRMSLSKEVGSCHSVLLRPQLSYSCKHWSSQSYLSLQCFKNRFTMSNITRPSEHLHYRCKYTRSKWYNHLIIHVLHSFPPYLSRTSCIHCMEIFWHFG